MRLSNKVAIVTGAGRGIGEEMALLFAAEGGRVVVADVDGENAERVASAIVAKGGIARGVQVDVSEPTLVEQMIQTTLDHFGRLDMLVNNAGIGSNEPFLSMTLEEWERNLKVNLTGTFLCRQAAARVMVRQGAGRIVNIASISGQRGGQGRRRLRRVQGRRDSADEGHGRGAGPLWHRRQRRFSGAGGYRSEPPDAHARDPPGLLRPHSRRRATASSARSPPPRCSWPPTRPASCTATS